MIPVANVDNITIKCPAEGRFSFFNSPYIAHRTFTGIDIYPPSDFGESAPSPVLGKVVMIRKIKCPKSGEFKASTYDYVILIKSIENPCRIIKVLHVDPSIKVGDTVEPGQELGFLLRSGYFDFWTDPHIHVEIRKPEDPIRARGGLKLQSTLKMKDLKIKSESSLKGTVLTVKPEYLLILLEDNLRYGLTVKAGGYVGVIDGGIPHYGRFGVHIERCSERVNYSQLSQGASCFLDESRSPSTQNAGLLRRDRFRRPRLKGWVTEVLASTGVTSGRPSPTQREWQKKGDTYASTCVSTLPERNFPPTKLKGLEDVKLINASIGKLEEMYGNAAIAKCNMFSVYMRKIRVGLSLYVYPKRKPLIKVIPPKPFCLKLEEGETISISITNA